MSSSHQRALRLFVDDVEWTELTAGHQPAVRFSAPDLQHAQRVRRRLAGEAILDVTVVIDDDFRSAQRRFTDLGADEVGGLAYAGTLDGLAGLIADIYLAGVADGVTLIAAEPHRDARALAEDALGRVAARLQPAA